MSLLGCVGDPLIEVEDATGAVIAAAVPIDGRTVSTDITANLPAAALTFNTFPEDRIVLFDTRITRGYDPLGVGAPRIARAPAGLGPASPRTLAVPEGNWRGLRSYDLGSCSFYLPWQALDLLINRSVELLLEEDPNLAGVGVVPVGRLHNTGPILRSVGSSVTDDQLRYNVTIGIADPPFCDSATIDVETRSAVFTETEATMPDRSCGGVIDTPGATDVGIAVLFSQAEQHDPFCAAEGDIETRLAMELATRLPEAFAAYIENITRFPAGGALPADPCECDADCSSGPRGALHGPRSRCVEGFCDYRIEPERLMVMPEGLVVVYAEDDGDPQAVLMPVFEPLIEAASQLSDIFDVFSCDPGRPPIARAVDAMDVPLLAGTYDTDIDSGS